MTRMDGFSALTLLSELDDGMILEATLPEPDSVRKRPRRERAPGALARFMNSGWAAAIISVTVALAVLAGIVAAGRMGASMGTPPPGPDAGMQGSRPGPGMQGSSPNLGTEAEDSRVDDPSLAQTEAVTEENEPTAGVTLRDGLIRALRKYLQDINTEYELIDVTYADKLDMIRNGTQAVYAEFDPSEVYYACGYYPLTETDAEIDYCCVSNYTWIGYEDPGDIQEYYDGAPCIVAFQINRAGSVRDILSDEKAVPGMEHFQLYKPTFQNGVNVSSVKAYEDNIVYLHSSGQDTVYFASAAYDYRQKTMLCTKSDGLVYLAVELYRENASGNKSEADLTVELGGYYDALMRIMILDQYQVQKENGSTVYYGLLKPSDLFEENISPETEGPVVEWGTEFAPDPRILLEGHYTAVSFLDEWNGYRLWSEEWHDGAMISGDSIGAEGQLAELFASGELDAYNLVHTVNTPLNLLLNDERDALTRVTVYDKDLNYVASAQNFTAIHERPAGTYIVILAVTTMGDYIPEADAYERYCTEYAFIMELYS